MQRLTRRDPPHVIPPLPAHAQPPQQAVWQASTTTCVGNTRNLHGVHGCVRKAMASFTPLHLRASLRRMRSATACCVFQYRYILQCTPHVCNAHHMSAMHTTCLQCTPHVCNAHHMSAMHTTCLQCTPHVCSNTSPPAIAKCIARQSAIAI
jgi:hypothetical protein